MKKKVLVLTLVAALMMTACGGKNAGEAEDAIAKDVAEEAAQVEENVEEAVENIETPEAEETVEEAADYVKGISSETGFESEWMGIRFTAPEGATMLTEEELNEIMGIGQDMLSEDFNDLQLKYAEMTSVSEMMCTAAEGTPNIVITAEKMMMDITPEQFVEALEQTLAQVSTMTYTINSDDEIVQIGGKDFNKISATADYQGQIINQDYYVMLQGDRAVTMTLTFTEETADAAEAMMSNFAAY